MRCPELQACALYSKDVTQMYLFFILKETLLNTDYSDMSFTTYYSTVLEREGLNENNATSSFALWVKSAWIYPGLNCCLFTLKCYLTLNVTKSSYLGAFYIKIIAHDNSIS